MNYIMARKIKVTGCLNCPYYTTKKVINEETKEINRVEFCEYPSFECVIQMNNEHIDKMKSGKIPIKGAQYFPEWCPLEMDNCVCYCNPVN